MPHGNAVGLYPTVTTLVMRTSVAAFADPSYYPYPDWPLKIGIVNDASGYSYAAYQLFKGDLSVANEGGEYNYSLNKK